MRCAIDRLHLLSSPARAQDQQIYILEWFYDRFRRFLPEQAVIKYENLISSRGRELAKFFPAAEQLEENLSSKNVSKFYDGALMADVGARLLTRDGALWSFYDKRDIEELLARAASSKANT